MAAISQSPARPAPPRFPWHRYRLAAAALAVLAVLCWIAVLGFDYYRLDAAHRAASSLHPRLRPSGAVGRPLGILGGSMFLLLFLYPLRKRWPWLSKKGKTKNWLDFHILLGLSAPAIITFHASFKLQGIAGLSYWIMMSVVLSGIIGRYLYGQIPRRLDAAEMSLQEMQADAARLGEQIRSLHALDPSVIAPLFRLPSSEEVHAMPITRAIAVMIALDLRRSLRIWKLRRAAGRTPELEQAIALLRRQAVLAKRVLFLGRTQQVFHLWHVVHRPFSYSFAILSALHVLIVSLLGY
jgi:hypothetical protein